MVGSERKLKAIALRDRALMVARDQTREGIVSCNARFSRARDLLLHAEARPMVLPTGKITAHEMSDLRAEALSEMRLLCAMCGLCQSIRLKPP
jgi:hypothetical protein